MILLISYLLAASTFDYWDALTGKSNVRVSISMKDSTSAGVYSPSSRPTLRALGNNNSGCMCSALFAEEQLCLSNTGWVVLIGLWLVLCYIVVDRVKVVKRSEMDRLHRAFLRTQATQKGSRYIQPVENVNGGMAGGILDDRKDEIRATLSEHRFEVVLFDDANHQWHDGDQTTASPPPDNDPRFALPEVDKEGSKLDLLPLQDTTPLEQASLKNRLMSLLMLCRGGSIDALPEATTATDSQEDDSADVGSHDEVDNSPSLHEVIAQLENEILSLRAHAQELRQSRRANAALKFQLAAASSPTKRKGSSLALALSELQKQHGLCTKQLQKHRHSLLAMHRKLLSVDAVSNASASVVHRGRGSDESSWYDAMFEKIDARLDLLIQQLAPTTDDDRLRRSITYGTHFDASNTCTSSSDADINDVESSTHATIVSEASTSVESTDRGGRASSPSSEERHPSRVEALHGDGPWDRQRMEEAASRTLDVKNALIDELRDAYRTRSLEYNALLDGNQLSMDELQHSIESITASKEVALKALQEIALECDELRSESMATGRQLDGMKEQYDALKLSACRSSAENAELKASVEDLKVQIGHYEDSCAQHEYTRQQLDKFVEKLRQQQELSSRLLLQLSDRESAMSFLESSLSDEREKAMRCQDEHQQQIGEQVSELLGQMERQARLYREKESTLQLLNDELQREVLNRRTQLQELIAERLGREEAVRRNELIIDDLTHQLAELMKGSQLVQADNAEYQQKCSVLQLEIDQHMRDHEELSSQLKSSEDSLEELRNEFRDYQQSKEAEQLQLVAKLHADADAAMKGTNLQLVREKEQLTIEKDLIIDDLSELIHAVHHLQADNAEYQQKCSVLQLEIDRHMRDHEELSSQLKSSEDSLEELRNEFRDYKQSKETEQLQLVTKWEERDNIVVVLEKEKLGALIALKETEQAMVNLQSERAQLENSTASILADMAARVAESAAHSTALSEELRVAREIALDQALAASSGAAALRAEIASLQSSLTKAKLKIIDLLRSKASSPSQ